MSTELDRAIQALEPVEGLQNSARIRIALAKLALKLVRLNLTIVLGGRIHGGAALHRVNNLVERGQYILKIGRAVDLADCRSLRSRNLRNIPYLRVRYV